MKRPGRICLSGGECADGGVCDRRSGRICPYRYTFNREQEIRQAQQDVRNEHAMSSELRAEIMEVQEDVRRESESEVSSAHSPTDVNSQATSASLYQVNIEDR